MNLKALHALSFKYDYHNSPVYGVNRNPDHLKIACENCIGACCIGSRIAHHNDPGEGGRLAFVHGCVHAALIPDTWNNLGKGGFLLGKRTIDDLLSDPVALMAWKSIASTSFETISRSQTNNLFSLMGACGELLPNGYCAAHAGQRPPICEDIQPGEAPCVERFVAYNSPAAAVFKTILNRTLPTLNRVRMELKQPHSDQCPFTFTSGK